MAGARASKGGLTIGGKHFVGGQFIPEEVLEGATEEVRALVGEASSQGAGFASPNVREHVSFEEALAQLGSERHRVIRQQFDDIDASLGLVFRSTSVIGDWGGGAEDSVVTEYRDYQDFHELRYAMAWKGKIAEQKAVLVFDETYGGDDAVYLVTVPDTIDGARKTLDDAGIPSRSVAPRTDGHTDLFIVDFGGELAAAITWVGDHYDVKVEQVRGRAEEIGVSASARREDSQQQYDRIISEYERQFPNRRHYRKPRRMGTSFWRHSRRDSGRPVAIGIGRRKGGGHA